MNSEQDIGGLKEKAIALENQMSDFRSTLLRIEDRLAKQLADAVIEIKQAIEQKADKSEIVQLRHELDEERKKTEGMQVQLTEVKSGWDTWSTRAKVYATIILMFGSMFMTLFSIVMTQVVKRFI